MFFGRVGSVGYLNLFSFLVVEYLEKIKLKEPAFLENAPGGYNDSYRKIYLSWIEGGGEWTYFHEKFSGEGKHCFIPAVSAAGLLHKEIIYNDYFYQNMPATIEDESREHTLFDKVYLPENNQGHSTITTENKKWFIEEIKAALSGGEFIKRY